MRTLSRTLTPQEIRNFRVAMGWSQDDLASLLHVTRNTVSRAERGQVTESTSTAIYLLWRVAEVEARATGSDRLPPPLPTDAGAAER